LVLTITHFSIDNGKRVPQYLESDPCRVVGPEETKILRRHSMATKKKAAKKKKKK
jgi:hypothetical protein